MTNDKKVEKVTEHIEANADYRRPQQIIRHRAR